MQVLCVILFFLPTCWKADAPEKVHSEAMKENVAPQAVVKEASRPPITASTPLSGRVFLGPPVSRKMKGMYDCEGCSEPGTLRFIDERVVGWTWRGSDVRNSGTYVNKEGVITIRSTLDSRVYLMRITAGGRDIVDEKSGAVFRDKRFPW